MRGRFEDFGTTRYILVITRISAASNTLHILHTSLLIKSSACLWEIDECSAHIFFFIMSYLILSYFLHLLFFSAIRCAMARQLLGRKVNQITLRCTGRACVSSVRWRMGQLSEAISYGTKLSVTCNAIQPETSSAPFITNMRTTSHDWA